VTAELAQWPNIIILNFRGGDRMVGEREGREGKKVK